MMLGFLLARAGVRVTVLEKHKDFFRDFRGDTVHPSTLEVLHELGLLEEFLQLPHQKVRSVGGVFGGYRFDAADFRHVPAHCKFVALMPQWDFLNFLTRHAREFPDFELLMEHEVVDLLHEGNRAAGVVARRAEQGNVDVDIHADLVVGCDGRHSTVRRAAQLKLQEFGVPIDVLWFRISRRRDDPPQVLGNVNYGKALILIDRGDYFQAGLIIRKGSFDEIKALGIEALRESVFKIAPYLDGRVEELKDWDQIKLLTVQINRLERWYRPGLLCIGDAAHAMSPAGGVGINLAIQDAVATANLLAAPLANGSLTDADLARVQKRREFPTRVTQAVQTRVHQAFMMAFENPDRPLKAPWQMKLALNIPGVHQALGYAVGIGVRPEHVQDGKRRSSRMLKIAVAVGAGVGVAAALFTLLRRRKKRHAEAF